MPTEDHRINNNSLNTVQKTFYTRSCRENARVIAISDDHGHWNLTSAIRADLLSDDETVKLELDIPRRHPQYPTVKITSFLTASTPRGM